MPAKLRYWDLYRERFSDMVSDADASFRELFGDEFAKAYEEQLERLKAQERSRRSRLMTNLTAFVVVRWRSHCWCWPWRAALSRPPKPSNVKLTIRASADVNPDAHRPSVAGRRARLPAEGRTTAFAGADFFALFDDEQKVLGPDLIQSRRVHAAARATASRRRCRRRAGRQVRRRDRGVSRHPQRAVARASAGAAARRTRPCPSGSHASSSSPNSCHALDSWPVPRPCRPTTRSSGPKGCSCSRSTSSSRSATSSATSRRAAPPLAPHSWGFTELELERDLLSIGKFGLRRAAGVFPDGTPFRMPDDDPLPAPIDIGAQVRDQIVYLAVPLRRAGARGRRSRRRARSSWRATQVRELEARDATSGSAGDAPSSKSARCARRFLLASEVTDAYACIPLAHIVECRADKHVVLDDAFIPTVLDARAADAACHVHDRAARAAAPARRGAGRPRVGDRPRRRRRRSPTS